MINAIVIILISLAGILPAEDLYDDVWVEGMARISLPTDGRSIFKYPILDVVPPGSFMKITDIFIRLNIDKNKIIRTASIGINNVIFHQWKISKKYKILIMTDRNNNFNEDEINKIDGYGVRIVPFDG